MFQVLALCQSEAVSQETRILHSINNNIIILLNQINEQFMHYCF